MEEEIEKFITLENELENLDEIEEIIDNLLEENLSELDEEKSNE